MFIYERTLAANRDETLVASDSVQER